MLNRRKILLSGAATAAVASFTSPAARGLLPRWRRLRRMQKRAKMYAMFDAFVQQGLDRSPESTTSLGLDTGARAYEKSKLDDRSLAAIAGDKTTNTAQLKQLLTIDRTKLEGMDAINYDVVLFNLQTGDAANQRYNYGPGGAGAPYIISQLTGSYDGIPDFLDSQHQIAVKSDADAYLSRLEAFAVAMDQEGRGRSPRRGAGHRPARFRAAKTLGR
jgi:uncharacterized protein (DUF885 family)